MKSMISFLATLLVLSACGIHSPEVHDGYAHLRELPVIKPKFTEGLPVNYRFYAISDTSGVCYVEINPLDLLNKRDSLENWYRNAQFDLTVKKGSVARENLFQSSKSWIISDDVARVDSFLIKYPAKDDLWFEINFSDLNKHTYFQEQGWWLRQKSLLTQHFILLDPVGKTPQVKPYSKYDTLTIRSNYFNNEMLQVCQYNHLDRPALSPFAFGITEPDFQKPDSVYELQFLNKQLTLPVKSAYVLIRDKNKPNQVTGFFTYSEDDLQAAYQSMTYISSSSEMEKMKDPKQAEATFNQFWIKAAGKDKSKTEKLQEEFMRRVKHANQQFSSYKLGCLTDRGMIYIVYGEPERIQKEGFQEIWSYRNAGIDQLNFIFYYDQDQMAPNNCYLERSLHYKGSYYIAVESWRSGFVLSDKY